MLMPSSINRLINVGLRGVTMVGRFLLIIFLAKYLEPSNVGLYSLLAVTVGYALFLLGFDFYIFTTREIIKLNAVEWGGVLKDQAALSLVLYAIFLPFLSSIFLFNILPWRLVGWFYAILILEHLNQEMSRLLIAVSEPITASWMLFFRTGIWAIVVAYLMYVLPDTRRLEYVMGGWVVGGFAAMAIGVYQFHKLNISGWRKQVDWGWIGLGLSVAGPFLLATLAVRALFTVDRYWFEFLAGIELLGVYALFIGICNALLAFLEAGVFAFLYPSLIRYFQENDAEKFRSCLIKMLAQTIGLVGLFALCAIFLIRPLLCWIGKPIYLDQLELFYWVLLAAIIYGVSMVPHYALYAQKLDKQIIFSHMAGFLMFVLSTWLCSFVWKSLAVPLGLCAAFIMVFLIKSWAFLKFTPVQYRTLLKMS